MKFLISVYLVLSLSTQLAAQNISFDIADPQAVIQEVYGGSLLSGDLDKDGDIDLVQSGIGENLAGLQARATVFLNDGNGNFTVSEQMFQDVFSTEQMALGDLDQDGDLDLIITGENRSDLYLNDGQAQFVHLNDTPFQPSRSGELLIGDVDGDGDQDVLQFGKLDATAPFALLFLNDGSGTFTTAPEQDFIPIDQARIAWIDLEGDGDRDLISFGTLEDGNTVTRLYQNDGTGHFSIHFNSQINPLLADEISVGDIDQDGDEDVLVTGQNDLFEAQTILYLNDGNGQFTEWVATGFPDLFAGTHTLVDLDNDDDLDVLLIGSMNGGLPNIFSLVFENLGNNNFVISDSLGGEYIAQTTVADFNGDTKPDIIIQGFVDDTNIYWNTSLLSNVTEVAASTLTVYPNPTTGQLQIAWPANTIDRVEIFNQIGERVYHSMLDHVDAHSFLLDAPAGLYYLVVYGNEKIASQPFLLTQ